MRRLKLTLSYDGTNYCGWQVQKNAVSVQETMQNAAEKVFGIRPGISGCSRTDSGVHALMYCCHLDIDSEIPPQNIVRAFNTYLPRDIVVKQCEEVDENFHARYSCSKKTYIYKIHNGKVRDPFSDKYELFVHSKLDEVLLNHAAEQFIGTHDFSAFCSLGSDIEDKTRTVFDSKVTRVDDKIIFEVTADGFLYNMVRIMAGTLIFVGSSKISPDDISKIIASKDRNNAGKTAPPHGLYLKNVMY